MSYKARDEALKHFGYEPDNVYQDGLYIGQRRDSLKVILKRLADIPEISENTNIRVTIEFDPRYSHFVVLTTPDDKSSHTVV